MIIKTTAYTKDYITAITNFIINVLIRFYARIT